MRTTSRNMNTPDDMIGNVKPSNPGDAYLEVLAVIVAIAAVTYIAGWGMILVLRLIGFA